MEFSIEVGELQRIFKALSVVTSSDSLGQILIEVKKDRVDFIANNGSIALEYFSDKCIIKKQGAVSIIYDKLRFFVSPFDPHNGTFGAKDVKFKTTEKAVNISIDNIYEDGTTSKGKLRLDKLNIYAIQRPKPFNQATFILSSGIMKTAIEKVLYAVNPQEVRSFIQGVCMEFDEDSIYFVGTDGLVLSQYTMDNNSTLKGGKYTIKYDIMSSLLRLLQDDYEQLFIEIENDRIKIKFGNVCVEGRIIIGHDYPDYKTLLEKFQEFVVLDKEMLLKIIVPFHEISDKDDYHRITLSVKDNEMKVYNDNLHFDYNENITFNNDFIIDINARLLQKTINAIKDNKLFMKFSDERGLLIFDSSHYENQKSLITPIKRR